MNKTFRAKAKAEREIRGHHVLQYSMLRDYVIVTPVARRGPSGVDEASTSKEAELLASDAEHDINDDVSSSSSEDPNFGGFTKEDSKALRSMINKQVGKAIKNVMPNEMGSYRDFTACDVSKFNGALDPIASTRWWHMEGAFRTSNYKEKNKVNFASNFLRDKVVSPFKCTTLDDLLSRARVREVDLLRKKNKEVKETKRKIEFGERDAKKPRHDQGRRSGGT
ncbi:hypothetical protein Tco_1104818 [Tanacetum coccineum]